MSKPQPPAWRRLIDRVDGMVTPPANAFVRTTTFADTAGTILRVESRVRRRLQAQAAWGWHLWNLPTASDIRKVQSQIATLEGRVRDLSEQIERMKR